MRLALTRIPSHAAPVAAAAIGLLLCAALAGELRDLRARRVGLDHTARQLAREIMAQVPRRAGNAALPKLPDGEGLARLSADLPALAKEQGVVLVDLTFAPATAGVQGVRSMLIGVRMKGRYTSVKGLLRQLLGSHDTLALMSLTLRRPSATEAMLDGEARLEYYYGGQP